MFDFRQEIHIHDFRKKQRMSSRYCSGKAMSSSSFDFYETPMPSASFCLPTPFDCLYLFTYRSRPVQTNKKIDDFFFVYGAKLSKIFKQGTYWIVFCEIRHTHISVLSNNPRFFKWWICISDFREEFLSADIQ